MTIVEYMRQHKLETLKVLVNAPVRIIDFGGWTDTWFAGHGEVQCISVLSRDACIGKGSYRGIEAVAKVALVSEKEGVLKLTAPDVAKKIVCPTRHKDWNEGDLIEATLSLARLPAGINVDVTVCSPVVPKGSSVGSSATVSVVLTALLDFLNRFEVDPSWVARTCHKVETVVMGLQCGVQDQAAAAYALGVVFIDIHCYPNFSVSKVALTETAKCALESKVLTIIYGGSHFSSEVHKMVIARLERTGRLAPELERLRLIPKEARFCLLSGDYIGLGAAMRENTEAQRSLHPDLISPECQALIDFCQRHGTIGEKPNGAGGLKGGSLSVLCGDDTRKLELARSVKKEFPAVMVLEHLIADGGLQVSIS